MKHLYAIIFLLGFLSTSNAQIINFPDANFKAKLLESTPNNSIAKNLAGNYFKIDANSNGEIEINEATNVAYLDISNSGLVSIIGITNFTALQYLDCSNSGSFDYNYFTSLELGGLADLQTVICHNTQLQSLSMVGCFNLSILNCRFNNLGTLNLMAFINLQSVDCSGCNLTSLNVNSLVNLTTLNCCCNMLTILDLRTCTNLKDVNLNENILSQLDVSGLSRLETLTLHNNQLTALNLNGCLSLKELVCWRNQISSLDLSGMSYLTNVECWQNQLNALILNGCVNLQKVDCNENNLTSINLSGLVNLEDFNARLNYLTAINVDDSPLLNWLIVAENELTTLDISLCPLLNNIHINTNNLISINIKNGIGLYNFQSYENPNLTYVCCDELEMSIVTQAFPNANVNSYCSFVPGGNYYTIQGDSKLDSNLNGCDTSDFNFSNLNFSNLNLSNLNLSITDGTNTGNFISNGSGNYSIPVQAGTQTITPVLENPTYYTISPTSFSATFPTQTSPFVQNFCITPNGSHQDVETWIIPLTPARPGFDSRYKIMYKNKGNTTVSGSLAFAFDDDYMDFISAMPLQNNQSFSLLNWNYSNLLPFETREIEVKFNINSPMETLAVTIGDLLKFSSTIFPLTGDEYSSDNSNGLNQIVVGSLDPNDKTCVEGNFIEPEMIGQYVHYVIRFENMGTFAAENIVVKDLIDETKFDISTLVPLDASHDFTTRITGSKVEFIFENINLPFDDENNDGYVAFKIKTKSTLALGTTFSNTANIYFDYNFPIITNTASTTIQRLGNQDFEFSTNFTLYPNPVKDILHIKSTNVLSVYSVSIYNPLGQLLQVITNPTEEINVAELKTGNYFIKVITDKGSSSSRFVKI